MKRSAFTLLELLVVLAILGAAVAGAVYHHRHAVPVKQGVGR
jgi:prepilin-type N-terminal cleavage/methylation domain-containing protein